VAASIWVVDAALGSSSAFRMQVLYPWVDADWNVVVQPTVVESGLITSPSDCV